MLELERSRLPRPFPLPQSTQAAVTNYQSLGVLNSRNLFLTVLENEKSKIKVPVSQYGSWVRALFLACRQLTSGYVFTMFWLAMFLHIIRKKERDRETDGGKKKREREISFFSYKTTNLILKTPQIRAVALSEYCHRGHSLGCIDGQPDCAWSPTEAIWCSPTSSLFLCSVSSFRSVYMALTPAD